MRLSSAATAEDLVITVHEARIDAAVATRFKDSMRRLIGNGRDPVIIDMQAVDFLDSSGLGAMIAVRKSMAGDRRLILRGLTPNVERVFRLTRMDAVFDLRPADPLADPPADPAKEQMP